MMFSETAVAVPRQLEKQAHQIYRIALELELVLAKMQNEENLELDMELVRILRDRRNGFPERFQTGGNPLFKSINSSAQRWYCPK